MPYRLSQAEENAKKKRALIALSSASVAAIVALWILYMNWTLAAPDAVPQAGGAEIFGTGMRTITRTVETGLINSYLYFHAAATTGTTFVISR